MSVCPIISMALCRFMENVSRNSVKNSKKSRISRSSTMMNDWPPVRLIWHSMRCESAAISMRRRHALSSTPGWASSYNSARSFLKFGYIYYKIIDIFSLESKSRTCLSTIYLSEPLHTYARSRTMIIHQRLPYQWSQAILFYHICIWDESRICHFLDFYLDLLYNLQGLLYFFYSRRSNEDTTSFY